ncbi:hypothetical protein ACFL7E_08325 [Thermodesulfobacteriota bacterium]
MKNRGYYQLFFTGKFVDGFTDKDVKEKLTSFFKGDEKKVEMLFSGRPILIKKRAAHHTPQNYVNAFKKAGIICEVKALDLPGAGKPATEAGVKGLPISEEKQTMTCPKCGHLQKDAPECLRCGIVVQKFQEISREEHNAHRALVDTDDETFDDEAVIRDIKFKNITTIALFASILLLLVSFVQKDKFPGKKKIHKGLYKQPIQTQTTARPFDTIVGGRAYHITPLYNYELYGLVVSYYDSTGWWDITHKFLWKDYINIKDICVVYGYNVITEVYKDMRFKSGSWTCWPKTVTEEARSKFFGPCLSNNHLVSDKKTVNKKIMNAEKGDQIHLKGYLVTYAHGGGTRGTSLTREDTGNGACETIYVTDFKILRKGNRIWRYLFSLSTLLVAGSIIIMIFFFIRAARRTTDSSTGFVDKQFYFKIIFQLLLLLALLFLWARLH